MQHTKSLTHVAWYVDVETGGVESFLSLKFYLYIYIYQQIKEGYENFREALCGIGTV